MKHAKRARTAYLRRVVSYGPIAYKDADVKRFNHGMLEAAAEIARLLRVPLRFMEKTHSKK